jgi:NAD(P)H-nitrite reductase large subunit
MAMETSMHGEARTRIVILGGGFGGIYAALRLEKALARGAALEVTLVNRENFFLFTPMLHEVAASDLDITDIVSPIRTLLRRVKFVQGEVEAIDLEARRVTVSHGGDAHGHELDYDHLVIGLGAITNFYDLPGVEARALTMKSLGDAIALRNRLIECLEEADPECCRVKVPLLTFVVAGGGFAGVETVAAVNDFVREALRFYPNLCRGARRQLHRPRGAPLGDEPESGAHRRLGRPRPRVDRALGVLHRAAPGHARRSPALRRDPRPARSPVRQAPPRERATLHLLLQLQGARPLTGGARRKRQCRPR